jgi:serine phosphatase RsbU (regulator of sigma subunit)
MSLKSDLTSLLDRLAALAAQVEKDLGLRPRAPKDSTGKAPFWNSAYSNLRDLFTQGITRQDLQGLYQREARDTLRFFTREIDFEALRARPWYKRYPKTIWLAFLAMAYRLSPPRRLAFAIATFAFLIGWLRLFGGYGSGFGWFLAAFVLLFLLLLMELRDKLDIKGDLQIAREIQFGLVPRTPISQDGLMIHCLMRPANTVGGDYYDIVPIEQPHRLSLIVGDVSGKGIPAALLMALLQGSLHTLITAGLRGPDLVSKLNAYLCDTTPSNCLITLFYGELNTRTGHLAFVNAGHNAPFVIRKGGQLERLQSNSLVLGVMKDPTFVADEANLAAGERLLIFTDGVSEAFNVAEEEYGETRLAEFLRNHLDLTHEKLIQNLISDVLAFCGSAKPSDDMTLMLISR